MRKIILAEDLEGISRLGAQLFNEKAQEAIQLRGKFSVALSGGSTPKGMYQHLARDYGNKIDWQSVHLFWGDERSVPPDHEDSNYRMANETLISRLPVLPHVHRIKGELAPEAAAQDYENEILSYFGESGIAFDLILLGMGDDGHTASLFPGSKALEVKDRWVVENYFEKFDTWRITLTRKAINAARNIVFLVSGENKAEVLRDVMEGDTIEYPSQMIQPEHGNLIWLIDKAAARLLSPNTLT